MSAEEQPYAPGGLPGVPDGAGERLGYVTGPVVTEEARKRLLEAFHGFGEGSGPPPGWRGPSADLGIYDEAVGPGLPDSPFDLVAYVKDCLRIREEAPCVAAPSRPLPRREKSPECAECSHPKSGHRDSVGMGRGCWNCRSCKGFVSKEGPA